MKSFDFAQSTMIGQSGSSVALEPDRTGKNDLPEWIAIIGRKTIPFSFFGVKSARSILEPMPQNYQISAVSDGFALEPGI
jgi:hypothetical protein